MTDRAHGLSRSRQAELLGISRGSLYHALRPIRHISTRPDQSRSRHNRAGNPLTERLETVQTNLATSILDEVERVFGTG